MNKKDIFKECSCCGVVWGSRDAFLGDPAVELVGYQVNLIELGLGFFFFNHLTCKTTLAVNVEKFEDLYEGPVYAERLWGTEVCPAHCLRREDLDPCPERCECACVREVIQKILQRS